MDISTIRVLRDEVKVWLIYAGRGRKFFDSFARHNRVYLNLPGFNANEAVFNSEAMMRRHFFMSDKIARYNIGATGEPPSRNSRNYPAFPDNMGRKETAAVRQELGNIQRLFVEAKTGDLIISPSYGYFQPPLIGQITRKWSKDDDLEVDELQGEIVPARRVSWKHTSLTKFDFAAQTAQRMVNRHAVTLIDEAYYADIFDTVFASYAWKDRSKLDLYGDGYEGKDPLQPYKAAQLLKYVMAAAFAFQDGQIDEFQQMPAEAAVQQFYDEERVEDLYQNFNSPGKFSVISKSGALAALIASGVYLATQSPDEDFEQQQQETTERVQGSITGAGGAEVKQEVENFIASLDNEVWERTQREIGVPAAESLGLSLDERVEVATRRDRLDAD